MNFNKQQLQKKNYNAWYAVSVLDDMKCRNEQAKFRPIKTMLPKSILIERT